MICNQNANAKQKRFSLIAVGFSIFIVLSPVAQVRRIPR
jgi:hypothetical protein